MPSGFRCRSSDAANASALADVASRLSRIVFTSPEADVIAGPKWRTSRDASRAHWPVSQSQARPSNRSKSDLGSNQIPVSSTGCSWVSSSAEGSSTGTSGIWDGFSSTVTAAGAGPAGSGEVVVASGLTDAGSAGGEAGVVSGCVSAAPDGAVGSKTRVIRPGCDGSSLGAADAVGCTGSGKLTVLGSAGIVAGDGPCWATSRVGSLLGAVAVAAGYMITGSCAGDGSVLASLSGSFVAATDCSAVATATSDNAVVTPRAATSLCRLRATCCQIRGVVALAANRNTSRTTNRQEGCERGRLINHVSETILPEMKIKLGIQNESVFSGGRIKPDSPELRIPPTVGEKKRVCNAFAGPVMHNGPVILHAANNDTSPKRKRGTEQGPQPGPSLALRASEPLPPGLAWIVSFETACGIIWPQPTRPGGMELEV